MEEKMDRDFGGGAAITVLPKGWAFLGLLRVSLLHIEGNSLNFDRDL